MHHSSLVFLGGLTWLRVARHLLKSLYPGLPTVGTSQVAVSAGERKKCNACHTSFFFFLTASAGIGPKVSEFAVKLDLASWSHVVHFMSIQA